MTITLDIKPELEAELAAQAAARGMDVPAYAAILLEQAAQPAEQPKRKQTLSEFLHGVSTVRFRDQLGTRQRSRAATSSYEPVSARYQRNF